MLTRVGEVGGKKGGTKLPELPGILFSVGIVEKYRNFFKVGDTGHQEKISRYSLVYTHIYYEVGGWVDQAGAIKF